MTAYDRLLPIQRRSERLPPNTSLPQRSDYGAMRLETEFRLCLQRQTLERVWHNTPDRAVPPPAPQTQPAIAPSLWVKLLQPPSAYCSDEALLLCQTIDQQWLAWIPDYGEIVLEREQFASLFE